MFTIVLLLKSLHPHTGNNSTAERIKSYFRLPKYTCILAGANEYPDVDSFHSFLTHHRARLVIGIHAFHAGRLLVQSPVPFVIIFGGTDLNEHSADLLKLSIMTEAVSQARNLVIFSSALEKQAQHIWMDIAPEKCVSIPQAVIVNPSNFNVFQYLRYNHLLPPGLQAPPGLHLFTLVAGIRPVKDPLFLVRTFSKWHQTNPEMLLLIIGPTIDEDYAKKFRETIRHRRGIVYIPGLSYHDVHAVIRDSYALVNSSLSEGMSTALLEAMALRTLVIVRDIPGNCSLVTHRETGLVYSTPKDFISCISGAMMNGEERIRMIDNAEKVITRKHSCDAERASYHRVVEAHLKS